MSFDKVYQNVVKSCKDCSGTGMKEKTEKTVTFCHCMKFYIFAVKNYDLGVPLGYIFQYQPISNTSTGCHFYFKEESSAFNHFMNSSSVGNSRIISSTEMYLLNDFKNLDLVLIYNLGLESFSNNHATLMRIVNEVRNRQIIGIFSFSIQRDRLNYHYPESICNLISCQVAR